MNAPRLGERLIAQGLLSADQLAIALHEQKSLQASHAPASRTTGKSLPLGEWLMRLGFIDQQQLQQTLAQTLGHASIELKQVVADPQALALVPKQFAQRHCLFPVRLESACKELVIACADPDDIIATDQLHSLLAASAHTAVLRLASRQEILAAIERCYGHELSIDGILHELEGGELDPASINLPDQGYSHPVVRLVDALLADACLQGASDIHFEPEAQFLRLRLRIDGVLRQQRVLHLRYWPALLVRLKLMAGMNIAENRAPQDGHFSLTVAGRSIDFRCALQPIMHGENLVIRILDRQRAIVAIDDLGMNHNQRHSLAQMLARPEGLILICGPTGSGKTTTLYSILSHLDSEAVNIMTLEDPVEYPLPRLRQTSLSDAIKLDYASGIRSLLRQDPDILLVGEIRDADTANMALRAALTGHLVFATVHSNSALRTLPRLLELGLSAELLAGNLIGIISQRLVRRLCPHCRQAVAPTTRQARLLRLHDQGASQVYQPGACPHCQQQGYRGRSAMYEILRCSPRFDDLLSQRAPLSLLQQQLLSEHHSGLAVDGLRLIADGTTSFAEVARLVDLDEIEPAC